MHIPLVDISGPIAPDSVAGNRASNVQKNNPRLNMRASLQLVTMMSKLAGSAESFQQEIMGNLAIKVSNPRWCFPASTQTEEWMEPESDTAEEKCRAAREVPDECYEI